MKLQEIFETIDYDNWIANKADEYYNGTGVVTTIETEVEVELEVFKNDYNDVIEDFPLKKINLHISNIDEITYSEDEIDYDYKDSKIEIVSNDEKIINKWLKENNYSEIKYNFDELLDDNNEKHINEFGSNSILTAIIK